MHTHLSRFFNSYEMPSISRIIVPYGGWTCSVAQGLHDAHRFVHSVASTEAPGLRIFSAPTQRPSTAPSTRCALAKRALRFSWRIRGVDTRVCAFLYGYIFVCRCIFVCTNIQVGTYIHM